MKIRLDDERLGFQPIALEVTIESEHELRALRRFMGALGDTDIANAVEASPITGPTSDVTLLRGFVAKLYSILAQLWDDR